MKKLLVFLVIFFGLANISYVNANHASYSVPPYIEKNTIDLTCSYTRCPKELNQSYIKNYYTKVFHKALYVAYNEDVHRIVRFGIGLGSSLEKAKKAALKNCDNNLCETLLLNNSVANKSLYRKLRSHAINEEDEKVPENAHRVNATSWYCDKGYKRNSGGNECIKIHETPQHAHKFSYRYNILGAFVPWKCNKFYEEVEVPAYAAVSASVACERSLVIPDNGYASEAHQTGWQCNSGYTRAANSCIILPANSDVSGSSWACNAGFTKTNNSCVKVPANARASGSSWVCNSGFTKTGKTCTNTAELNRIKEAKQIAEAKAAKVRKASQLEAQNYFQDLELFLKTNTSEYDIVSIINLIGKNKAILTAPWNTVLEKNFAELKSFTLTSKAFQDYHQSRNDLRQRAILNKLDKANTRLKNISAYLNFYAQNNMFSNIAQDVLKQIKIASDGLKLQELNELTKLSTQLEQFIAKNKLSKDYLAFIKSLSKTTPDAPEVSAQKIDATDLVNFEFIKKANRSDYLALVNLSGKAPNALLNLEGSVVFENDKAISCFYQSKNTIKNDLKYYLYDTFSNKEFLIKDKGFECNQNNLLSYDLVFFEKGTLLKESKSYVASLAASIAYNELQFYKIITKEQQTEDFAYRKNKVGNIIEGLEEEMMLGFGSLVIDNDSTTLCTDVDNTLGQASIMSLLSNEFTRMGYGKSVGNVAFNNVEDTFANVQRGRCGFIYAGEETLANLLNAFKSSGTKYDVLPIWYSKKDVKSEQLRQDSKEQSSLINVQKRKEQADKDKKLAELRAEAEGVVKKEQQERLRNLNRNIVESHVQLVTKEAELWLDEDPEDTGEMLSLYPNLLSFIEKKWKESWELDKFDVDINDYGLSNYRDRIIETFITEINFRLKNNDLGEYDNFCIRVAILDDKEFKRFREPMQGNCELNSLRTYKKRLDFQSSWVVE